MWGDCSGCKAKDLEIARLVAEKDRLIAQMLERGVASNTVAAPAKPLALVPPVAKKRNGRVPLPPWAGALACDGHLPSDVTLTSIRNGGVFNE